MDSPEKKLEFVRRVHERTSRRDPTGLELVDPDVEWDTSAYPFPDLAGVYHGHQGVARFWSAWHANWAIDEYRMEEFIETGDEVVVGTRGTGRGRDGIEVEVHFYAAWKIRDGKLARLRMYADLESALEAARLTR